MAWQEISVSVPYEYVEPVSYLFSRYGHGLTMELEGADRVLLRTYLPGTSRQRLARIEVGVRLVSLALKGQSTDESSQPPYAKREIPSSPPCQGDEEGIQADAGVTQSIGELTVRPLPEDEDWQNAWKAHFTLLKLGQHLVIKPSWIDYTAALEDVVIELDPGMAFGTGYHPTTYTCLEALERLLWPGMSVLDLGTGSGILTIAAAKLGAIHMVALDIDPQAVRAARQNFRRVGILRQVALAQGTVPHALAQAGQFDLVVANISARAVRERAPFILPLLKPQGTLIASGIIDEQRPGLCDALLEVGFSNIEVLPREEWVTLLCSSAT